MKYDVFCRTVGIEERLRRGVKLSDLPAEDQEFARTHKVQEPKRCGVPECNEILGPRVDGERDRMEVNGQRVEVCWDCYTDALDKAVGAGFGRPRARGAVASD